MFVFSRIFTELFLGGNQKASHGFTNTLGKKGTDEAATVF